MPLKIRFVARGAKKRPVLSSRRRRFPDAARWKVHRAPRHFRSSEAKDTEGRVVLDQEKAKAWIAKGAQPTTASPAARRSRVFDAPRSATIPKGFAEEKGAGTCRRRGKGGHAPCLIVGIKVMVKDRILVGRFGARTASSAKCGSNPLPVFRRPSPIISRFLMRVAQGNFRLSACAPLRTRCSLPKSRSCRPREPGR